MTSVRQKSLPSPCQKADVAHRSQSVSLPELIRAIRGQIPNEKCDLLEDLVQKLQRRELRLNRQEFLHKVKDIAGEDAPALRLALKQLAVERRGNGEQSCAAINATSTST